MVLLNTVSYYYVLKKFIAFVGSVSQFIHLIKYVTVVKLPLYIWNALGFMLKVLLVNEGRYPLFYEK